MYGWGRAMSAEMSREIKRKWGSIGRAALALALTGAGLMLPSPGRAEGLVVNTTADGLVNVEPPYCRQLTCSLRGAITDANLLPGGAPITFDIPGDGPHTITITEVLPQINAPGVTIDATTQPGYNGTPVVQLLDGASIARGIDFDTKATGSVVRGLSIGGFGTSTGGGAAIGVAADDVTVAGNWLGISPTGQATPNTIGLRINGPIGGDFFTNAVVGGPNAGDRNVISANSHHGVFFDMASPGGHTIEGNYIGTTPDGTSALGNGGAGIVWNGEIQDVTVKNNVISGNGFVQTFNDGMNMRGGGHVVVGNKIGTDVTGTVAIPNEGDGIEHIGGTGGKRSRIGGSTPERNVISGNGGDGIDWALNGVTVEPENPHLIEGNRVGTNLSGTAAIPNGESGIELSNRQDVRILGNIVSGNGAHGIDLQGVGKLPSSAPTQPGTGGVVVQRNHVGTDASGIHPVGNALLGIHLHGVFDALVGGDVGSGNVVSANGRDGIRMARPGGADGGHRNLIKGNRVGAPLGGSGALGNLHGVTVHNGADDNVVEGNTIVLNREDGVAIGLDLSNSNEGGNLRNDVRRNVITENGKLGIDILNNGEVLPNDNGDGDSLANLRQNYPVLTDAPTSEGTTSVTGSLNSTANASFRVDVYANASCDASGHGEGRVHVLQEVVTTDAAGNVPIDVSFPAVEGMGFVAATATDAVGNTSEFSNCVGAPLSIPDPELSIADATVAEADGEAVLTVTLSRSVSGDVRFDYAASEGTATDPEDLTTGSGTATIAAGASTAQIEVALTDDALHESDETFTVTLSSPSGATIADGEASVTIRDDDPPPDTTPPAPPVLTGTDPTSPADEESPSVLGIAEAGSTVHIHTDPACATDPVASGSAAELTEPGITVTVGSGSTTTFHATATDAAGNTSGCSTEGVTYIEVNPDTTPPNAPTLTATIPASPSDDNSPKIVGTAEAGSTVRLYTDESCTSEVGASGSAEDLAGPGMGVTVSDESTTTFHATATDAAGNVSSCSAGLAYVHELPTLSIDDVTVREPEGPATFTVSASKPTSKTMTVAFSTEEGTAIHPEDFAALTGTLTFVPGDTSEPISITVADDSAYEPDETLTVALSNPTNARIADGRGEAVISDDDPPPDTTAPEAPALTGTDPASPADNTAPKVLGAAELGSTVRLYSDPACASDPVADGTAESLAFPGIEVTVADNSSTTIHATATDAAGNVSPCSTGVTYVEESPPPPPAATVSVGDVRVVESAERAVFPVTLSGPAPDDTIVSFSVQDGSAKAAKDFAQVSGSIAIPAGSTSGGFSVPIIADTIQEADETFTAHIAASAEVADGDGLGIILDDDTRMSIADVAVDERDRGTLDAVLDVTLKGASWLPITAALSTAPGTAAAPADYSRTSGEVSFPPGTTKASIRIPIVGDTIDEFDETVFVRLSSPVNAVVADGEAVVTIRDDDKQPTAAIDDVQRSEAPPAFELPFTVRLSTASGKTVTVGYSTLDGTATTGEDFVERSGTLVFPPGVTQQSVTVDGIDNSINELTETFSVGLASALNARVGDGHGIGTIADGDELPTLSINEVASGYRDECHCLGPDEGNSGTRAARLVLELHPTAGGDPVPAGREITVDFATRDGRAKAGTDYVAQAGVVRFLPGDRQQTITLTIRGDRVFETDANLVPWYETFSVHLENHNGATGLLAERVFIVDDDAPPVLNVSDPAQLEGDSGTRDMIFTVSLQPATEVTNQFVWHGLQPCDDPAATDDEDFVDVIPPATWPEPLVFAPGETTKRIRIPIIGDQAPEGNEWLQFQVRRRAATGPVAEEPENDAMVVFGDAEGCGVIVNDD